jgi:altronate dehydratase large subunit
MTGVSASGANVIIFTSGGGAPQGFPLVPVIKVAANPDMVQAMKEHVDVDVSSVVRGVEGIEKASERIIQRIFQVCSGDEVAAETSNYNKTVGIYTTGPTI